MIPLLPLLLLLAASHAYTFYESNAISILSNKPTSPNLIYSFGQQDHADRNRTLLELNTDKRPPGAQLKMTFYRFGYTGPATLYFFILHGSDRKHHESFDCDYFQYRHGVPDDDLAFARIPLMQEFEPAYAFIHVRQTGVTELFILFCPQGPKDGVVSGLLTGQLYFINKWGHLDKQFIPIYIFIIVLVAVTAIIYIIYGIILCKERANFIWIHGLIEALALISLVTNALLIIIFTEYNTSGHLEMPVIYGHQTLGTLQNTIARVLLLLLFKGYGLMDIKPPIVLLSVIAVAYLAACLSFEIIMDIDFKNKVESPETILMLSFAAMLVMELVFYLWIANSYLSTIKVLTTRKQNYKLYVLRSIFCTVAAAVFLSALIGIAGVAASIWGTVAMAKARAYLVQCCWKFFFAAALCRIMLLIRPNRETKMLIEHEELHEDLGGGQEIELGVKDDEEDPPVALEDSEEPKPTAE